MALQRLSLSNTNFAPSFFVSHREDIDLRAPYQRASVWTITQRRNLIKSLLMGLPISAITMNKDDFREVMYTVIDGKQRVETILAFIDSEFAVPAEWFEEADVESTVEVDGFTGVLHSGLTQRAQRRFSHSQIACSIAQVSTVAQEAEIFGLINSGGTAQTEADLANAQDVANSGTSPRTQENAMSVRDPYRLQPGFEADDLNTDLNAMLRAWQEAIDNGETAFSAVARMRDALDAFREQWNALPEMDDDQI